MNKVIHMKIPTNEYGFMLPVKTVLEFIKITSDILGDEYKLIATPFDVECVDGDAKVITIDCKLYSYNELKEIIDGRDF